ncbi:hypothetical protein DFH09DRAFT_1343274 [Mycena vulgaris]|nr:hypothetical protein DFH09DRAFT_1343274 [Mycena vulgaris]
MPFIRKDRESDDDYIPPKPKRLRTEPEIRVPSPPTSPTAGSEHHSPSQPSTPEPQPNTAPLPSLSSLFGWSTPPAISGSLPTPETPGRAQSLGPPGSSPMSSVVDVTPVKAPGAPPDTPSRHSYEKADDMLKKKKADAAAGKERGVKQATDLAAAQKIQAAAAVEEQLTRAAAAEKQLSDLHNTRKAHRVLTDLTKPTEEGGYNFKDLNEFFESMYGPQEAQ